MKKGKRDHFELEGFWMWLVPGAILLVVLLAVLLGPCFTDHVSMKQSDQPRVEENPR